MNNIKKIAFGFLAIMLILFGACKKDQIDIELPNQNVQEATEAYSSSSQGEVQTITTKLPFTNESQQFQVEIIDGLVIFGGDMILGTENEVLQSNVILGNKWINGIIPYEIESGHPLLSSIMNAINHVNAETNLTLVPRNNHSDYVRFKDANGCSSRIGRIGGEQDINIGPCSFGSIVHEICHAAGLYHEHQRSDRDLYVTINYDNIQQDKLQNFEKNGVPFGDYDYRSIMHYRKCAFSIICPPESIKVKIPPATASTTIGQRNALSVGDIESINSMYPLFEWSETTIPDQSSKASPAVALYNGRIHMVHLGNSSNDIWHSIYDGNSWSTNVKIPNQKSKATPALAVYNGKLHMVHLGDSSNDIWHSEYDENSWSPNVKILGQQSKATPSLATYNGLLHMVHLGDSSNDIWHSYFNGNGWSANVRIPGQQSKAPPSLATYNGLLHMVHLGDSSNDIWYSYFDGVVWSTNVRIPGQQSKASPALAEFNGKLHLVHLGDSSNDIWHSWSFPWTPNGMPWTDNLNMGAASKASPALVSFSNQLHMLHIGSNSHTLYHAIYQ